MGLYDYLPAPIRNPFVTEGHNRYANGEDAPPEDEALSLRHHRETIAFEGRKAKEHRRAAKGASDESRSWNLKHAKHHEKEVEKRQKAVEKLTSKGKVK